MMPAASEADIKAAVARELAAEARHCYGFEPTVALMRAPRRTASRSSSSATLPFRSDSLGADRARRGEEVTSLIDRIFVSCDMGGQGGRLFRPC
jgi:hypothetical protein